VALVHEAKICIIGRSVNEYQLRLGRQRQVWFIPLAEERWCAGKTVRFLENACHVRERLRGVFTTRRFTNPRLYLNLTWLWPAA